MKGGRKVSSSGSCEGNGVSILKSLFEGRKREFGTKEINIHVVLERSLDREPQVFALLLGQLRQLDIDMLQVQESNLLVEDLGQNVDANLLLAALAELNVTLAERLVLGLEQHDLREDLVGEGAGHDEGGVAGRAAEVDEATFREEDDVAAVGHEVAIYLRFDVLDGFCVLLEPGDVDLDVEMADI